MILVIDTNKIDGDSVIPSVTWDVDGVVTLNGRFREACIADAITYLIDKGVRDASDYHFETYHQDDET